MSHLVEVHHGDHCCCSKESDWAFPAEFPSFNWTCAFMQVNENISPSFLIYFLIKFIFPFVPNMLQFDLFFMWDKAWYIVDTGLPVNSLRWIVLNYCSIGDNCLGLEFLLNLGVWKEHFLREDIGESRLLVNQTLVPSVFNVLPARSWWIKFTLYSSLSMTCLTGQRLQFRCTSLHAKRVVIVRLSKLLFQLFSSQKVIADNGTQEHFVFSISSHIVSDLSDTHTVMALNWHANQ